MAKLKAAFGHSVTILWARIGAVAGLAVATAASLSSDATFSGAVQQIVPAQYWPFVLIGFAVIVELARWRTASTSGDS